MRKDIRLINWFLLLLLLGACSATVVTEDNMTFVSLEKREGPRPATSGTVPHVQLDLQAVPEINEALFRLAFSLPNVENQPSAFSLPGARGMVLNDAAEIARPDQIVSGREFAHIHPDGSLHASLPPERALQAIEAGWAEKQPIADQLGIPGLVMLYTPQNMEELSSVFQLIVDSYNFVTGKDVQASEYWAE